MRYLRKAHTKCVSVLRASLHELRALSMCLTQELQLLRDFVPQTLAKTSPLDWTTLHPLAPRFGLPVANTYSAAPPLITYITGIQIGLQVLDECQFLKRNNEMEDQWQSILCCQPRVCNRLPTDLKLETFTFHRFWRVSLQCNRKCSWKSCYMNIHAAAADILRGLIAKQAEEECALGPGPLRGSSSPFIGF